MTVRPTFRPGMPVFWFEENRRVEGTVVEVRGVYLRLRGPDGKVRSVNARWVRPIENTREVRP